MADYVVAITFPDNSTTYEALSKITSAAGAQFGHSVAPGRNAILAETVETTTEPLDTFVESMGGTIVRRPLDEVVAELEAQDVVAQEAARAAHKAMREEKKQRHKEKLQERVDALKAKFHKD